MWRRGGIGVVVWLVCSPASSHGQALEVAPFVGYRFGGGFFERVTGEAVDLDGARAVGAVVNVRVGDGLFVEALVTHQSARVTVFTGPLARPVDWRVAVDHWQGGGLQEFGFSRRVRPFAAGLVGLTRYGAEGDDEIRFTVGGGGGVKIMPGRRLGVRLDGRLFATLAYFDAQVLGCGPGVCLAGVHADIVWQAEFSAGLVVAFP
jgi:hypothetical protein